MHIRFTKMQGAGNDFVVLDETQGRLGLTAEHYRFLADRHFGVGADQILTVRPSPIEGVDFEYVIHNADGGEVEQCGNGARCFARYVYDKALTTKTQIRVLTKAGVIAPQLQADGRVTVNMGVPILDAQRVPFDVHGLQAQQEFQALVWSLDLPAASPVAQVQVVAVSMGNPHAVQWVQALDDAPVVEVGALIERHPRFVQRVNAGFMQTLSATEIKLRVYERGAGETLACGTGACAAVVAGILRGQLAQRVNVHTRGGILTIEWAGGAHDEVWMTGPATTVFEGQIHIPEKL